MEGFEIGGTAAVMTVEPEAVAVPGPACRPETVGLVVGIESAIVLVSTPLMTNKAKITDHDAVALKIKPTCIVNGFRKPRGGALRLNLDGRYE